MSRICLRVILLGAVAVLAQAQSAANGKVLYDSTYRCYSCHGFSGQNGPGARLVPMKMSQTAFMAFVRHPRDPRKGTSPAGQQDRMPPYSAKVLPDSGLADIYAYIKTLPVSPAAKDIPLLNQFRQK